MKKLLLLAILLSTSAIALTSQTTPNAFGNGYNTRYSDGSSSQTTTNAFGNGYTTRFSDGSSAETRMNAFGNGTTTNYY